MFFPFCLVLVLAVVPPCVRGGGPATALPGQDSAPETRESARRFMTPAPTAGPKAAFRGRLAALQAKLEQGPTNLATLYELGQLCYDKGGEGDGKAVRLAEKYFRRILDLDPKQALARALLGSTLTMKARDSFWPPTRLGYARSGIKDMDAAVQMAPEDPEVRFVRAVNNVHMPRFMGREAIARADFAWLWQMVQKKPGAFKEDFKQTVALFEGRILKQHRHKDQAIKVWEWGLKTDPKSPEGRQIRELLTRVGVDGE